MPQSEVVQRQLNGFFSFSAEVFRFSVQWGFLPLIIYLGAQKPAILPSGEQVPFHISQIFYDMTLIDNLAHFLKPYYLVNLLLSLSFLFSKTLPFLNDALYKDEKKDLDSRSHEILLMLALVIMWKNRKATNWLQYLNTAFLFSKAANTVLFFRENVVLGIGYLLVVIVFWFFVNEPLLKDSYKVQTFTGTQLHDAIEADYSVIWVVNFFSAWSTDCKYVNPVFSSLAEKYALSNLRFAKLDVGRYPKEGERFRINTHVMSKQLPSIAVIRNGKQVNRRPAIGSNQRAIPFKFTEENCCREFEMPQLFKECQELLKRKKKHMD